MRRRSATFVFVLDFHFTTIYRMPPRLALMEMSGDLPADENLFAAGDSQEWIRLRGIHGSMPLSMADSIRILLEDAWDGANNPKFSRITIWGMFMVISGTFTYLF